MAARRRTTDHATPPEMAVLVVGVLLVAFGVVGLLAGGSDFAAEPFDGDVRGELLLGVEANGWTNALFVFNGAALILGSATRFGASFVAAAVGLDFAAAAVVAFVDGADVVGIFATNSATRGVWAALAVVLLAIGILLPRRTRG